MVRDQVRVQVRYAVTIRQTNRVDQIYSNYIRNKPKRPVPVKSIQPSKQVVTIVQIRQVFW